MRGMAPTEVASTTTSTSRPRRTTCEGSAIAGRRSYLDAMLGLFLPEPEPGDQRIVVPVYYDGQLRVDWDGRHHGTLSVFLLTSSDRLRIVQADAGEEESFALTSAVEFWRVIASYKRPLTDALSLTLSPGYGRS